MRFILIFSFIIMIDLTLATAQFLNFEKTELPKNSKIGNLKCYKKKGFLHLTQIDSVISDGVIDKFRIYLSTNYGKSWFMQDEKYFSDNPRSHINNYDRVFIYELQSLKYDIDFYNTYVYSDDYGLTWKKLFEINTHDLIWTFLDSYEKDKVFFYMEKNILIYSIINERFDTVVKDLYTFEWERFFTSPFNNYCYFRSKTQLERRFYLSKNYGITWDTIKSNYPLGNNWEFLDENNFYMISTGNIMNSTDGGSTWESIYKAPFDDYPTQLKFWGRNMVFAQKKKVFYSNEPFINFKEVDVSSFVDYGIDYFRISSDGFLYLVTDSLSNLFVADLKSVGLENEVTNKPDNRNHCKILYLNNKAVFNSGDSSIGKIYISDLLGRMVFNEQCNESYKEIELGNLTSGVYFLTVISNEGNYYTEKIVKY
jgi:hypothetical protein